MATPVYMVREPDVDYATLPPLLVDSSLLAAIYFAEAEGAAASERIAGYRLIAPSIIDYEIANVAMNKVRRGALPAESAKRAIDAFAQLRLERHGVLPQDAFALAVLHGLTAYDAAYLHLAVTLRAPLATLDRQLAAAAQSALSSPARRRP
jgi:predicted nucleic acid-binding protein